MCDLSMAICEPNLICPDLLVGIYVFWGEAKWKYLQAAANGNLAYDDIKTTIIAQLSKNRTSNKLF